MIKRNKWGTRGCTYRRVVACANGDEAKVLDKGDKMAVLSKEECDLPATAKRSEDMTTLFSFLSVPGLPYACATPFRTHNSLDLTLSHAVFNASG